MEGARSFLKRHILSRLFFAAGLLSALLLFVFLAAYRNQLVAERSHASLGFNLLLQAALENAMLKRDVPGLADIVARLGRQPGIRGVMILNPKGEVRFASNSERIGLHRPDLVPPADAKPIARFETDEGIEVLRSINAVRNREPCKPCHGAASLHPVNGILVVDYDAGEIRAQAWKSAIALAAAGIGVLALIMVVLWRSLNRRVLVPVAALGRASAALEEGRLAERVHLDGDDELSALGERFNRMAARLEEQMARVRAHDAYLQQILDGLPDGVRVIRIKDKQVVLANRAFCEQVGRPVAEVIGRPCHTSSHDRLTPCPATLVVCPLTELQSLGTSLKATHHHRRIDGKEFPVEVHAMRIALDDGRGQQEYLVEAVRDLGKAVHVSQEQRLSELGMLAAGIAHEIHNPLGSIRLGVQGLTREIRAGRNEPEQIVNYLELIDQEIDNCIAVTRRLLLLARPPSGSLQLIVINDALVDTLRLLDYDARMRGIEQTWELPAEPLRLLADEAELRMVFFNLTQNAHHAMPNGGKLHARLSRNGDQAQIEIADTGVGMTPETLARIFDPFFSQRADGVAGTGLGLTIVKNLIERLGGHIMVESSPGQGSCFTLLLPLAETSLHDRT